MLDGDRTNVAFGIDVEQRVLVQIARLEDRAISKLDVERVGL